MVGIFRIGQGRKIECIYGRPGQYYQRRSNIAQPGNIVPENIMAEDKGGICTKIIEFPELAVADLSAGVNQKLFTPKNSTNSVDPVLLINFNIKKQAPA